MRFLADESCDLAIIHGLRANGHDVIAVSEVTPRAEDSEVIRLAVREKRILLTDDKDFGRLVYSHGQKTLGVISLRFPTSVRTRIRPGWTVMKPPINLSPCRFTNLTTSFAICISPTCLENNTLTQGVIHKKVGPGLKHSAWGIEHGVKIRAKNFKSGRGGRVLN
jgi:predicted nuclease of predicted toxin-antitoxin system